MSAKLIAILFAALIALTACNAPGITGPGGRLVFERTVEGNTDVYVMNADGSGLQRLTDDPGWDGTPSWSPNGTQIVFASERQGAPVIYLMNDDGSDQRPLTDPIYTSLMPAWSPDGELIAYATTQSYSVPMQGGRQEIDAGLEIWVMTPDGANQQRVTGDPQDQALYPTWAPRGDRLAYMQIGDEVHIVTQAPDGEAQASVLTQGLPGRHWTPAWSPRGDKIAFKTELDDANTIVVMPSDGGDPVPLTEAGSNATEPAWSPDGRQLVFVSDRDGPLSLYLMDADGQNVRRLTTDEADYARPDWSQK